MTNDALELMEQQKKIHSIPFYEELFQLPNKNNFSITCINKSIQFQAEEGQMKNSAFNVGYLNDAAYRLCILCNDMIDQIENDKSRNLDLNILSLKRSITVWTKFIETGNAFATYEYAKHVIESIVNTGYPFLEKLNLSKNKIIVERFQCIPKPTKFFIRLVNYGIEENRRNLLKELFQFLYENPRIFKTIERVEIARDDFPKIRLSNDAPSFSVFFNYEFIKSIYEQEVREAISFFREKDIFGIQKGLEINYSAIVSNNTYLSQGFNNYKKYLKLLGAIGMVYDKNTNYAFANLDEEQSMARPLKMKERHNTRVW